MLLSGKQPYHATTILYTMLIYMYIFVSTHLLLLNRLCQSELKVLPQMKFNLGQYGLRAPTFQAPLFQASMEHALQCAWEIHHLPPSTTSAAMQGDLSFSAEKDRSARSHTTMKYHIKVGSPTEITAKKAFNLSLNYNNYDINSNFNDNNNIYMSQSQSMYILDRYIHSLCGRDTVCIDTYNQLQQYLSNHTQFTPSNISVDSHMNLTKAQDSLIHRIIAAFPFSSFADSIRYV